MNEKLYAWIHDDITWCSRQDCPIMNCMRNTRNMLDKHGLHSYADFRETEECQIYCMEKNMEAERGERE